jgi:hypothetical protein
MTKEEKRKYDAERQVKYRANNREKVRLNDRKYYKNNTESIKKRRLAYKPQNKNRYLKNTYGISIEDYKVLLTNQNNGCAICGSEDPKGFKAQSFHVDHDHETGQVRGLLCQPCNMAIGLLKENISTLSKAIMYLNKNQT